MLASLDFKDLGYSSEEWQDLKYEVTNALDGIIFKSIIKKLREYIDNSTTYSHISIAKDLIVNLSNLLMSGPEVKSQLIAAKRTRQN
jgi:hypothetical protein